VKERGLNQVLTLVFEGMCNPPALKPVAPPVA
jgi:hypothetical protein